MVNEIREGQTVKPGETFDWQERGYDMHAEVSEDLSAYPDNYPPDDAQYGERNAAIQAAYTNGLWEYVGITVTAERCEVVLGEATIGGVEANFKYLTKDSGGGLDNGDRIIDNCHMNALMSDLSEEVLEVAKDKLFKLQATLLGLVD